MAKGLKFDWQLKFEHAGKQVYVQGDDLDGAAEMLISGNIKQGEYGRAELSLLVNCAIVIKIEGSTVWNRNKGGRQKIPSVPDPERDNATTAQRLLTYIVTRRAPHLAEMHPDAFEEYYDEEVAAEMEEGQPNQLETAGNPTGASRGPVTPIESRGGKEI